jgi:DNA-binding transcriptional regulator YhcF (GntR family)
VYPAALGWGCGNLRSNAPSAALANGCGASMNTAAKLASAEYLADMLAVRRTSVTVVAHTLQQAGMIKYTRGRIKLIDLPALQETACECYQTVKLNYDAFLHTSNK